MQGVKGENFENRSQKVFFSVRLWLRAILCRTLGQLSVRHGHGRARRMKICQNGHGHRYHGHLHGLDHDHRCHAMLVFISPTAEGHVAHLTVEQKQVCCCWEVVLQLLCFNPIRSGVPKRRNRTQFEKGKKETQPPAKFDGKESPLTVRQKR